MVNVLVRLIRALPLLAIVAVVTAVLYGLLVATSTRDKARRVIIRVLSVINGALTVLFTLVTLYALFENNVYVLELADVCAALFAIAFIIVRVCAWRMRCKQERPKNAAHGRTTGKSRHADASDPADHTPGEDK